MKRAKPLESLILTLRGRKIMLDADLAELYGVPTKVFNQAVKRNADRFPEDFMFQLTPLEASKLKSSPATSNSEGIDKEKDRTNWSQNATSSETIKKERKEAMRSQFVTAGSEVVKDEGNKTNWSQFVTSSRKHRGAAYRPFAFTEHGAIMAATVLNSAQAVAMSVYVVRAFMQMREQLAANATILKRLAEIDKTLLEHDSALRTIWTSLQPLLAPPLEKPRRRIGFNPEERP